MHNDALYPILMIAVAALVTWLTRAIPFLVFGKRQLPGMVVYLGEVLPPAIMVILVIYCLRNMSFTTPPYGLAELAACGGVFLAHKLLKNMYVSIILGTVCYMLLLRVL